MRMSQMAMNRIVEERAAKDKSYRRALERKRRPLLSHGRAMSDDELLAKLRQLGFETQRQGLADDFANFVSAEAMSRAMIAGATVRIPEAELDWIWIATTCLWERWQPDLPNMEMVDDKMQAGYVALETGDTLQTCRLWLETWRAILVILGRAEMNSLDEFDDRFGGTQSVFNWVQDLETELHNAGLEEPGFFHERITLCETMLDRFPDGALPVDNFKTALAASYFELGDLEKGDRLFRVWLEQSPQWGSGWIAWSDCYWLFAKAEHKDATRAEQILQEGLASPGVENRADILERLQLLYEKTGRKKEAEDVREEIKQAREPNTTTTVRFDPSSMQVTQRREFSEDKPLLGELPELAQSLQRNRSAGPDPRGGKQRVGRNDACPCGSGKKFKKCCARKPR